MAAVLRGNLNQRQEHDACRSPSSGGCSDAEDEARLMQELTKGLSSVALSRRSEDDGEREERDLASSRSSRHSSSRGSVGSVSSKSRTGKLSRGGGTQDFTFAHSQRWEIERTNKALLSRIASIHSRKGRPAPKALGSSSSSKPPVLFGVKPSRAASKGAARPGPRRGCAGVSGSLKQREIARENAALAKRLSTVKGSITGIKHSKSAKSLARR